MYKLVALARALLNRYPRLVWIVFEVASKIPGVGGYLERRWNIRLLRQIRSRPVGYRLPLSSDPRRLSSEAQVILEALER
ncbi:hypothetical protein [Thiorhodococcus minor]|uniref:Uncharacterized protein n=1 Tax=Thiorhodococcus minor TaxID=57489 RepID=A0A6M0JU64_9GAMM|nr:hypothetical protein [Thiorhodococcus minor]NEV61110.1 hypothetical protein [Thiorhodococcus minor]